MGSGVPSSVAVASKRNQIKIFKKRVSEVNGLLKWLKAHMPEQKIDVDWKFDKLNHLLF